MSIAKDLLEGLEEFLDKLKSGKPIKTTRVTRKMTPDGPMHEFSESEIKPKEKKQ
jgi:hypothetical protein